MQSLNENCLLKFHPDTLQAVRREVNLDDPRRLEESIDILEDWIQKQPHFIEKDFSRGSLERMLIAAKGLVERTKSRIDRLCTCKTLMPEYFSTANLKADFAELEIFIHASLLPQLTPGHHRVYLVQLTSENLESRLLTNYYKYVTMLCEYMLQTDYNSGYVILLDFRMIKTVMNVITRNNPIELRKILTLITLGYGGRIKGVHFISSSKTIEVLITVLKQLFSNPTFDERLYLHKDINTLYDYVPKDMMPADYGGNEKTLRELNCDWQEVITSNEFLDNIHQMKTDESLRRADKFCELYADMPGSFRALSVD